MAEECANCGAEQEEMATCARCRAVHYCNRECQRMHWKHSHRHVCGSGGSSGGGEETSQLLEAARAGDVDALRRALGVADGADDATDEDVQRRRGLVEAAVDERGNNVCHYMAANNLAPLYREVRRWCRFAPPGPSSSWEWRVLNRPNSMKSAPLHWAVSQDCPEMVAALLDAGADANALDAANNSPLDLAISHRLFHLSDLILLHLNSKFQPDGAGEEKS